MPKAQFVDAYHAHPGLRELVNRYQSILLMQARQNAATSPFADTRPLPLGPQLQVTPREDWLQYRQSQQQNLETYSWVNKEKGIVSIPVEQAMDILVKKGLPVAGQPASTETPKPADPAAPGGAKQ